MNAYLLMPEVYLAIGLLALLVALGATWAPLLALAPLLVLIAGALAVRAVTTAGRARFPTPGLMSSELRTRRALAALLCVAQPLVRLEGRLRHGLTPWRRFEGAHGGIPRTRRLETWRETWVDPAEWLRRLERGIADAGAVARRGGEFDRWDLEIRGGVLAGARVASVVEEHGAGRQLVRLRCRPSYSSLAVGLVTALAVLAVAAGLDGALPAALVLAGLALLLGARLLAEASAALGLTARIVRELSDER
jgi:hypothetical protein